MRRPGGKIAILGGGVAGLSAAWRLSEPGWQNRFDSITVYQRGWRLGGKGASSRGMHGRIEEHGLHVWLGSYENAFTLLRECYTELDRDATDPTAPIRTWRDALIPADNPALAEEWGGGWQLWFGTHPVTPGLPGDPQGTGREVSAATFVTQALQLAVAFVESLREAGPGALVLSPSSQRPVASSLGLANVVARALTAATLAVADRDLRPDSAVAVLSPALEAIGDSIDRENRLDHRRLWVLLSLVTAVVRGILADHLITHPSGFRAINDEEFGDWVVRHGGHPDALRSPLVRGLYDLVFGYRDADPDQPAVAAGVMTFLLGQVLFGYKGSLFWKMTAGMGDVVIAPLYQALRRRGVVFEFFHRLDALHLDARRQHVEAITMGRQVALADGVEHYDPLITVRGLPVFPAEPRAEQIVAGGRHDLESHFGTRDDVEKRVLRRGVDFDHAVLAVSLGMVPTVANELLRDRVEWHEMTTHVRTVATQGMQLWLRPDEKTLGWERPGATVTAYQRPFETFASMPHTLWAEDWPADDRPRSVAHFCGSLPAPWPCDDSSCDPESLVKQAHSDATDFVDRHLGVYFPHAVHDGRFARDLVTSQHLSVNIDPSDRYVQSVPGSDKYRLRPDESGYDNLVLAGDWTDTGINAGCIEAAVVSGLQAANAVAGRGRYHRVRGYYMP
ncbi:MULTISPECIES: FAD-dependent oxidoreductase [unclassified Mycolicibacterium]|uniref:FAD-dependent oxidoreductase n=1 Tax=unclassified Mycolicibacterium TaxID=2636767 RepID=UPI002EDB54DE